MSEALRIRIAHFLADEPVVEKKLFGGVAFMFRGNMLCGISKKGDFMVRISKELEPEAKATLPGAAEMDFTKKKMGGFLFVDEQVIEDDAHLAAWIAMCLRFVRTLPEKKKKPKKAKK